MLTFYIFWGGNLDTPQPLPKVHLIYAIKIYAIFFLNFLNDWHGNVRNSYNISTSTKNVTISPASTYNTVIIYLVLSVTNFTVSSTVNISCSWSYIFYVTLETNIQTRKFQKKFQSYACLISIVELCEILSHISKNFNLSHMCTSIMWRKTKLFYNANQWSHFSKPNKKPTIARVQLPYLNINYLPSDKIS